MKEQQPKVFTVETREKLDKVFTRLVSDENFHVTLKTDYKIEVRDLLSNENIVYRYVQPNKAIFQYGDYIALLIHDGKEAAATYQKLDYREKVSFSSSEITNVPDNLVKQMQDFCDNNGIRLMRY